MPINICDYNWSQTNDKVAITLNLNYINVKDVDIITTSSYLKVSFIKLHFYIQHCIKVFNTLKFFLE